MPATTPCEWPPATPPIEAVRAGEDLRAVPAARRRPGRFGARLRPRALHRPGGGPRARRRRGGRTPARWRAHRHRAPPATRLTWDGGRVAGDDEVRDGVPLTNLDQPLFEGAEATKRDLVDYLDVMGDRIIPQLRDRPLSVGRVLRGQAPFMQKNVPRYTPPWVRTVSLWAESSKREVSYALCDDRRTLLWFANQRAVEYHPTLVRADRWADPTHLVLDIDP